MGLARLVYTLSTDVVKWLGVGSGGGVAVDGGAGPAVARGAVAERDRAVADVFAESGERGAADDGEVAVPGADPGVWELAVSRAAGASLDLGTADGRGQSCDHGVVLLAVRPVCGGAAAGAAAVDSVPDREGLGARMLRACEGGGLDGLRLA